MFWEFTLDTRTILNVQFLFPRHHFNNDIDCSVLLTILPHLSPTLDAASGQQGFLLDCVTDLDILLASDHSTSAGMGTVRH